MTDLLIAAINVGERRREDYGDIDALAASNRGIQRFGEQLRFKLRTGAA